jgi:hypothetical protein
MSDASRRGGWIVPLAGGLGALIVDVLYLLAIAQQGATPPGARVPFVAGWIAAAGILSTSGTFISAPSIRAVALGLGAAMLLALGLPAIFSFGIALLLCAGLVGTGALRAAEAAHTHPWMGLVGPVVLLVIAGAGVAIGFAVTDF